jgi:hypothetical protein
VTIRPEESVSRMGETYVGNLFCIHLVSMRPLFLAITSFGDLLLGSPPDIAANTTNAITRLASDIPK